MAIRMMDVYNANMGGDAFKNYFEVAFHGLPVGVGRSGSSSATLTQIVGNGTGNERYTGLVEGESSYRIKNFTVPGAGVATADIKFMSQTFKVPVAAIDTTYEITTDLRIDRFWKVYQDIIIWRNKVADPATGRIGWDSPSAITAATVSDTRCRNIIITADAPVGTAAEDRPSVKWTFSLAFPSKVGEVSFDYSSGEPITVGITFAFNEMDEYFYQYGVDNANPF